MKANNIVLAGNIFKEKECKYYSAAFFSRPVGDATATQNSHLACNSLDLQYLLVPLTVNRKVALLLSNAYKAPEDQLTTVQNFYSQSSDNRSHGTY